MVYGHAAANRETRMRPLRPLAETDKDPEAGGAGSPLAKAGRNSPRYPGRCAELGGAEVVVPRNDRGSAADQRPDGIAGAGQGSGGAMRGTLVAAVLARGALSLCSRGCWARSTNWNVQTADCDVTKGPARLASPAGGAVTNPRLRIPLPASSTVRWLVAPT